VPRQTTSSRESTVEPPVLGADVVVVGALVATARLRDFGPRQAGVRARALNEDGTLLDDFRLDEIEPRLA
jgi:hypothetical protein